MTDTRWLAEYPEHVPANVDPARCASLGAMLEESCDTYARREAFTCMGHGFTFSELRELSAQLGAWLQAQGLKPGDRVAVMLPNILQYPVVLAALFRGGFVAVNVNPLYTPRELEHQLVDSESCAIIVLENFAHTLAAVIARTRIRTVVVATMGDLLGRAKGFVVNQVVRHVRHMVPPYTLPGHHRFLGALRAGASLEFRAHESALSDLAALQYTGGTTGLSKGAMLTHRNLVSAVLSCEAWMRPGLRRRPHAEQLNIVCALPLYHAFAFITCGLLGMRIGARNILIPNPRDMSATIKALSGYPLHIFPAVNTLFNAMLNHADLAKLNFDELLITVGGGMSVQESVARRWLDATGCPICEGYGLSETSAAVAGNRTDSERFTGSVGLPMPGVSIRIVDAQHDDLPPGAHGEIAISGPQVMRGYWRRPEETAQTLTPDGWLLSGDIGSMDERGYVRVVDRKKDMIIVSGFNVYPSEIEAAALEHPAVVECAAVGVPDDACGEAVKLYVVSRDATLTSQAVSAFLAERLTGYKRPRTIEFRTELPKTNLGKTLRRQLRDELPVNAPAPEDAGTQ